MIGIVFILDSTVADGMSTIHMFYFNLGIYIFPYFLNNYAYFSILFRYLLNKFLISATLFRHSPHFSFTKAFLIKLSKTNVYCILFRPILFSADICFFKLFTI